MPKAKESKPARPEGRELGASQEEAQAFELDEAHVEQESSREVEQEGGVEDRESSSSRQGEREGAVVSSAPAASVAPPQKDPLTQRIEGVLEEDLKEVYLSMPPDAQQAFRAKGEEVTGAIRTMIETAQFSVRNVLRLIRDWLRMIPGVNRFFLEQEAKIKTDKLSEIAKGR